MPNVISFFTGAGGLDIGLNQSGFDIKLSVEIEELYCETLKSNYPDWNVIPGDIMDYDKEKVYELANFSDDEEVDLMVGGSPCQSFSTQGKRLAFGTPGGLAMIKYAELITEIKPKIFLLENVKGLLSAALKHRPIDQRGEGFPEYEEDEKRGSALKYLLSYFKDYNVDYKLLNAADYGVPQKRERVFFVGIRKDLDKKFTFPETTHSKNVEDLEKEPWIPVSDILDTLSKTKHTHTNYSEERLKYMRKIPQGGGNWRDLRLYGDDVVREAMGGAYDSGGGKVGFYRRIKVNEPAPTLLTSPIQKSTNLGHPYEDRPLSIEEYLAIQQFPSDYIVTGSLQKRYVQIGNAVPIGLAKALGKKLFEFIKED